MNRSLYGERDYAFGQLMLTLRTTIGLTQAGLADVLGISRRAVAQWEAGLSYPKAERLKQLITLGVQQQAFAAGREAEEIRALWRAAHQKVLLDERWLQELVAPPVAVQLFPQAETLVALAGEEPAAFPRVDWGGALDVSHFAGREVEVAELTQWIVQERCRLIALLGMGGIGKSTLVSFLGQHLAPQFEAVLWRSVRDAPSCEDLVADCITFFSQTPPTAFPTSLEQRINQLLARLQAHRCLLVLDNLEALLASREREGGYLPGYEGYGRLIGRLAESAHQSCVLLTSREKPREIEPLEGMRAPVRALRLEGVDEQAAQDLLSDKGLSGTPAAWQRLVASYAGNPLALKIVAQAISDLFSGDLDHFLQEGELIFNGIRPVLRQQMGRLSPLEHLLLTWLAVLREWTPLETLVQVLHPRVLRAQLLEALEALGRRSLLERGQRATFSLQSVVMEYLSDALGERLGEEIVLGEPQQLRRVALEQALAKDYVRQTQVRLLVHPLTLRLRSELGGDGLVEAHLLRLLEQFRSEDEAFQGYGPANVISLLKALRGHLRGLDFSRLSIRGAYLQGVEMQDTTLAGVTVRDSTFTEAFAATRAVAICNDGTYWAAGGMRGEVRVWRQEGKLLHLAWQAHTDAVAALTFSPDGRTLATGSWDGFIKLWELERGALLWTSRHTDIIHCVAFSPDGHTLASGGDGATVRLWDAYSGTHLQTLTGDSGPVYSVAWSPAGTQLASAGTDRLVTIWAVADRTPLRVLSGHSWSIYGVTWSPDGRLLASSGWDSAVRLWDASTGTCVQLLRDPDYIDTVFYGVAWSPDGLWLATGSYQQGVQVWEVTTGTCRWVGRGLPTRVRRVEWSPDGTRLASCCDDGSVFLWEASHGRLRASLQGHRGMVMSVAWSPDGTWLASGGGGSESEELFVWDVQSGERLHALSEPGAVVYALAWSPTGMVLLSGGSDGMLRWWDLQHRECVRVRKAHQGAVQSLKSSPDGHRLASCGDDGVINVWDLQSGDLLQTLRRDRPYERLDITGIRGLTEAQKASLHALGAIE